MRLNQASDFALRILMLLAEEKKPLTVDELSTRLRLVKSHVMKIVAKLVRAKILHSQRGRSGGVSLGKSPQDIMIGDVVRSIENDMAIVECMREGASECVFLPRCKLKSVMGNAKSAFMAVLDQQNLQSIIAD